MYILSMNILWCLESNYGYQKGYKVTNILKLNLFKYYLEKNVQWLPSNRKAKFSNPCLKKSEFCPQRKVWKIVSNIFDFQMSMCSKQGKFVGTKSGEHRGCGRTSYCNDFVFSCIYSVLLCYRIMPFQLILSKWYFIYLVKLLTINN